MRHLGSSSITLASFGSDFNNLRHLDLGGSKLDVTWAGRWELGGTGFSLGKELGGAALSVGWGLGVTGFSLGWGLGSPWARGWARRSWEVSGKLTMHGWAGALLCLLCSASVYPRLYLADCCFEACLPVSVESIYSI